MEINANLVYNIKLKNVMEIEFFLDKDFEEVKIVKRFLNAINNHKVV
jgi:hypothetical protein